ncbi:DNA polymerase I [Corallococcus macrosporus]|uniref:DNA polymerase I n=1 Tax=Myxococcus fulvus (strain ATCC BAA-855 / HW-1) TaxID=483219 RepID=F8CMS7_MYXFH|nr:DNA polymerase I [Corallococcus macrosporus]AEI66549.1 DNA polymerase I [Corallococcus macrosporus]
MVDTSPPRSAPTLVLIDASGFIFRAYHAIPPLTTSKGVQTNAVLGFTRMVLKALRELKPTHVALAFDKESRTERQKIDPTYKANREGPPEDLVPQFALIRRVVEAINVPVLEVAGWEADDVIGTLAVKAKAEGFCVQVVTGDKDFVQIVDSDVRLYDPMKDVHTQPADVKARLGIEPGQMRDYLALIGDAVDNVPKVPGIGPKTATELIQQFGDVETLLSRLDEVKKPKIRENIASHRESLLRAKQLVTFKTDLALDVRMADLARRPLDAQRSRELFTELEFFALLKELPQQDGAAGTSEPPKEQPAPLTVTPTLVGSDAELMRLAGAAREAGAVTLIPAYEGAPFAAKLVGLGVALPDGQTAYVPLRHAQLGVTQVKPEAFTAAFREVLEDAAVKKGGHDLKALSLVLANDGLTLHGAHDDVELLSYLLNPSRREHALVDLARERLYSELPPLPNAAEGKRGKKDRALADHTVEEVATGFAIRAEAARRLAPELWKELEAAKLAALARDMELPLLPLLARMERRGVLLDTAELSRTSVKVDAAVEAQVKEVYRHAGREFNIGSNPQLVEVLFTELKLPVIKRGKTGPSADQEVLEKLSEEHPLPGAIIEYRSLSKLKSTYLDTLPTLVAADGRIHTTYHQAATATGRLSSTDPNLQNIPVRTDLGREIRRAFVAAEGHQLVSADYSQVELRLLAHIANDAVLIEAFLHDEDIHTRTAAEVFGVAKEQVDREQRRVAKMVNFGIAYGLSPHGLAARLGIAQDVARDIIERYFTRYAGIKRYLEETVSVARKTGYVETLYGRRRYMADLNSKNRGVAQAAERAAINMPIQGTAADLIKKAMLAVDAALEAQKLSARMLLQVHDELLFEAPDAEVEAVKALAVKAMSSVADLKVPLKVDVGAGRSWADAH